MPTEITVTGCGDCPMYKKEYGQGETCHTCNASNYWDYSLISIQNKCPLKNNNTLTIKLKENADSTNESH